MKTTTAAEIAAKERTELKSRRHPLRFGERAVVRCAALPRRSGGSVERRTLRFQRMAALTRAAATPTRAERQPRFTFHAARLLLLSSFILLHSAFLSSAQTWITNSLTISETNTNYDGLDLVISGAGVTVAVDGPHALNSLLLTNGAVLTHSPCTVSQTHKLDLTVSNAITVSTNSVIDVSGKGYLPGYTSGNTAVGASTGLSGGSYGGKGGDRMGNGPGYANTVYGDYADPSDWGSGGSPEQGGGGAGGGLVRLTADALVLDGQLLADGANNGHGGNGSGGGIYVVTRLLSGGGELRARGGNGYRGGGGGGRIAVYAEDWSGFNLASVTAPGGTTAEDNPGGAGTVWLVNGLSHTHVRYSIPGWLRVHPTNGLTFLHPVQFTNGVAIQFNKPIATNSFTPAKFLIQGPLGSVVPTGISEIGDRLYRIAFPPQTEQGTYHFTLLPTLLDAEGCQLDQNANGIPGEPDDAYTFTLILDTIPPRITQHAPAGDVAGTVSSVDVWFSEAMDKAKLVSSEIVIRNPASLAVSVTGVQEVGLNRFRISFPPQTAVGSYTLAFSTNITDLAGNALTNHVSPLHAFNLVPVDLRLADVTPSTNQLWANSLVTVAWTGRNASGAPLLGDWTDAVYLSADDRWDIRDVRVATVAHTGGLASNEVYAAQASFDVPGLLPGNYHLLIRADIFNQEREATNETDNVVAYGPLPLSVPGLVANGPPATNTLTQASRANWYVVALTPGQSLRLSLIGTDPNAVNELYVSQGEIPTRSWSDHKATQASPNQDLAITGSSTGGVYYVLVYGAQVGTTNSYSLFVETRTVFLTSMSQYAAGNSGFVSLALRGAGFPGGLASVRLVAAGQPDITDEAGECLDSESIAATFDLRGSVPGGRDVVVTFTNGMTVTLSKQPLLADSHQAKDSSSDFDVLPDGGANLITGLEGPSWVRWGETANFTAFVMNIGPNDAVLAEIQVYLDGRLVANQRRTLPAHSGRNAYNVSVVVRECHTVGIWAKIVQLPDCESLYREILRLEVEVQQRDLEYNQAVRALDDVNTRWAQCNCDVQPGSTSGGCNCVGLGVERDSAHNLVEARALILWAARFELTTARKRWAKCQTIIYNTDTTPDQTWGTVCPVISRDPNDKVGPAAYGEAGFVQSGSTFYYKVRFENVADANGPAQQVLITDTLDPNFDLSTFELIEIVFGTNTITLQPGIGHYEGWEVLGTGDGFILADVQASLNPLTRKFTLALTAVDPVTGWFPADPFAGLLYPNDSTGRGEGSVSFRISPRAGLPTGTVITNRASIVFDYNDPIETPTVFNTIDAGAPQSSVTALPGQSGRTFLVQWAGQDDAGGTGVASYDVYVSTNGVNYLRWLAYTTNRSAWFVGEPGRSYSFYAIARDWVGNEQSAPGTAQVQTAVPTNAPVLAVVTNRTVMPGSLLSITNTLVSGTSLGAWRFMLGQGAPSGTVINETNGVFSWMLSCSQASRSYPITVWITDTGNTNLLDATAFTVVVSECVVPSLGRLVLQAGDSGKVPIHLISSVPLTNLAMTVAAAAGRLTNLWVESILTQQVCTASLTPSVSNTVPDSDLFDLSLLTCSNQFLIGTQQVAWLHFTTVSNLPSAFVSLNLDDITGYQSDGTAVRNFAPQSGRLVIVGEEPLLECLLGTNGRPALVLYGKPDWNCDVDARATLDMVTPWQFYQQTTLTDLFQTFHLVPASNSPRFFRAVRK